MKAFGGRGIWFSGFFLLWPGRRGRGQSSGGGKMTDSQEGASTMGGMGSLKVTGVTFGANAIPVAVVGSTGMVHTSLEPSAPVRLEPLDLSAGSMVEREKGWASDSG